MCPHAWLLQERLQYFWENFTISNMPYTSIFLCSIKIKDQVLAKWYLPILSDNTTSGNTISWGACVWSKVCTALPIITTSSIKQLKSKKSVSILSYCGKYFLLLICTLCNMWCFGSSTYILNSVNLNRWLTASHNSMNFKSFKVQGHFLCITKSGKLN